MHISEQMFGGNADSLSLTHHTHTIPSAHPHRVINDILATPFKHESKHLLWLTALLQHPGYYHSCCLKCVCGMAPGYDHKMMIYICLSLYTNRYSRVHRVSHLDMSTAPLHVQLSHDTCIDTELKLLQQLTFLTPVLVAPFNQLPVTTKHILVFNFSFNKYTVLFSFRNASKDQINVRSWLILSVIGWLLLIEPKWEKTRSNNTAN